MFNNYIMIHTKQYGIVLLMTLQSSSFFKKNIIIMFLHSHVYYYFEDICLFTIMYASKQHLTKVLIIVLCLLFFLHFASLQQFQIKWQNNNVGRRQASIVHYQCQIQASKNTNHANKGVWLSKKLYNIFLTQQGNILSCTTKI